VPKDYDDEKAYGEIKNTTTNDVWIGNRYATKLEEGTTVYTGDRDYRKGEAPFDITIEEDGEVVLYENLKKDEDKEEGDADENDEEIQDYSNKKLHKMDDGRKVTNANVINEHINIDVTSDYDEDLADGADMKTIKH